MPANVVSATFVQKNVLPATLVQTNVVSSTTAQTTVCMPLGANDGRDDLLVDERGVGDIRGSFVMAVRVGGEVHRSGLEKGPSADIGGPPGWLHDGSTGVASRGPPEWPREGSTGVASRRVSSNVLPAIFVQSNVLPATVARTNVLPDTLM